MCSGYPPGSYGSPISASCRIPTRRFATLLRWSWPSLRNWGRARGSCATASTMTSACRGAKSVGPRRASSCGGSRPKAEWQCIIHEAYPAYISWEQYVANQARLHDNAQRYTEHGGLGQGAPRDGAALLQGLATCGLFGHRMRVSYRPHVHYVCDGLYRTVAEPACARLDGASIEAFVIQAFFNAIAPAQLETLDEVLAQRQRERHRLETYHQQQVSQARYEATLARRRYEHVDPDYRLAAAELERAWEDKLRALRQAEEAAERFAHEPCEPTLSPERREQLLHLSQRLPALWSSTQLSYLQRKALLRSLIARVMVQRMAADRVAVKIIWVSGHFSQGMVIPPVLHQRHITGYDTMVERIRQLWAEGYTDNQIAQTLSREGFRSARRDQVLARTVLKIRNHHHWVSRYHQHRLADKVDDMWTIHGLSRHLGVEREWFYHRIRTGTLREPDVIRKPPYGNYLIRDDAVLLARLRTEVHRGRRVGRGAATEAIAPEPGASPAHPVALDSSAARRARTSRTNRI